MNCKIINGKYIKTKRLGSGAQGKVYLVEDKDHNKYIAKIIEDKELKNEFEYLEDEMETKRKIEIFKKINSISCPYLIFFKEGEIGDITKNDKIICKRTYYIFEYCQYGDLFLFVNKADGFGERITKLIFKKIVLGVKALHEKGIYHRDLKLNNIVIDNLFNPKICDLDLCQEQIGKLKDRCGTINYNPPQKIEGKEYSGDKADIFSLGCLLYFLMVHKKSFHIAEKEDSLYNLVIENQKESFFKKLGIESFNNDFKDLYYSMIAYNEEDRPTLDEILKSKWLDEINNLNDEMIQKLENEAKEEIIKKKDDIDSFFEKNSYYLKKWGYETSSINRGCQMKKNDYANIYFKKGSYVHYIDIDLEGEIYIKINGDFDYWIYMNCFLNEIKNKEKCEIFVYDDSYKCNIIYKKKEKYVENEELIIKLKLYLTGEDEYLLRFLRISGGFFDYFNKVKNIRALGEELIQEKFL